MKALSWMFVAGVFCVAVPRALAQSADVESRAEAVEIPLEEIWAWDMPGTKNIGELDPDKRPRTLHGKLVGEIRRALAKQVPDAEKAKPAFAVQGTGLEALRQAHAVLVNGDEPRATFPIEDEVCVVFFARQCVRYVYLIEIRMSGNALQIDYQFVPHETMEVTEHFAIIPLGRLKPDRYEVSIEQVPLGKNSPFSSFPAVRPDSERRIVSRPFSFTVEDTGGSEEVSILRQDQNATIITRETKLGLTQGGLRVLEPGLLVLRDTPEKIARYSTPAALAELNERASRSLVVPIEQAMQGMAHGKPPGPGFAVSGHGEKRFPASMMS